MNSMPQHAVTNGYWNSENLRAQLTRVARACDVSQLEAPSLLYSHPIAFFRQT